jgi:hypothetical protein
MVCSWWQAPKILNGSRPARTMPVMHGWPAEVFGHDAVALRDGRLALSLEHGEAVVIETGVERKPRAAKAR